jgi:hypothetical protein
MAGAVMVGFGIPINDFGIGDTLISAGTTAVVGGLVLIGLAAALRQLRAVADAVQGRAWPVVAGDVRPLGANPLAAAGVRPSGPIAAPPTSPSALLEREPRPEPARGGYSSQPRFTARPPPHELPGRELLDEEQETYSSPGEHDRDAEEEPGNSIPFAPGRGGNARGERQRGFDAIWPAAASEPDPRPIASYEESEAPTTDRDHDEVVETASSSILKSGVIDGMVYTLYTDGSIEAELPQGTLKFGSIDELRDYLLNKE